MVRPLFIAIGLLCLLPVSRISAHHPGVGIVRDSRGTIFYTDLEHVWMIRPGRAGVNAAYRLSRKQIAVRHVHTHELALDAQDNLYGEDLAYEGEVLNRWHHRIWQRSLTGRVTDLFGQRAGFRQDYGFVRDRKGNQYWIHHDPNQTFIRQKQPNGRISTIRPSAPVEPILNWLTVSADGGTLYVSASRTLYQIKVTGETEVLLQGTPQTSLMGVWPGHQGSLLVADFGGKTIQEVDRQGRMTIVARVAAPWAPSGMLRDPAGSLWILEYSTTN